MLVPTQSEQPVDTHRRWLSCGGTTAAIRSMNLLSRVRRLEDTLACLVVDDSQTHDSLGFHADTHPIILADDIQTSLAVCGERQTQAGILLFVVEEQTRQVPSHTDPNPLGLFLAVEV